MKTKKFVMESLSEYLSSSSANEGSNSIERFNIENDPDAIEMLDEFLDESNMDIIPDLQSILGKDVYYIGHGENTVDPQVAPRVEFVEDFVDEGNPNSFKNARQTTISSESWTDMYLYTYTKATFTFVCLTEGVTNGWFTDARGMEFILSRVGQ
jgi:hypothetical protein